MKKLLFFFLIILLNTFPATSQPTGDNKLFEHTIAIQANQLLRQIINLDVDNALISNPYLLHYSLIRNKSKWGIMAGFGYDYEKTSDKESPGNHESRIHDISARLGIGRKFSLGKKLYVTAGVDFVKKYVQNKTVAVTIVENTSRTDSTMNVSNSIDNGNGGGFQLRLGWDISKTITISTEATLYFMNLNEKDHTMVSQTVLWVTNPQNNSYTLSSSNAYVERSEFKITAPVAIFLGIKF